ncbi:hypothetical protein F5Y18DRAFT_371280 [Xylariaceae sp. FL1019]|nr:hypothetical protein F5Y18DRAFT_371280 [Xylariaceae sp. FL1019]
MMDMDEEPRRPKSLLRLKLTGFKDKVINLAHAGSLRARVFFLVVIAMAIFSIVGGWIGLSTDTVNKTRRALNPVSSNDTMSYTTSSIQYDYIPTISVAAPESPAYLEASLVPTITEAPTVIANVKKRDSTAADSYNYGQIETSLIEESVGNATYNVIIVTTVTTSVLTQSVQKTTTTDTKTVTAVTSIITTLFATEVLTSTCITCTLGPPIHTTSTSSSEPASSVFCLFNGFTNVYTPCDDEETDTPFGPKQTSVDAESTGNHNMENPIGSLLHWFLGDL